MGKHESPPFHMVIEGGRLVPSTPFDAERLDSYRRGTKVRVHFTEEKDRVLVRKWFAILSLVVKQCDVPWQNKEQASEAIKLALGIVNLSKTISGKFMQYPKSLTELKDPELQEAVDKMIALIERMTGVDPETLKKEAADVGGDIEQEPSAPPSADAAAASETPAPQTLDAAATPSQESDNPEASASIDNRVLSLMEECRDKFLQLATDDELSPEQRWGAIAKAKDAWKDALPENLPFVRACFEAAGRIVKVGPALEGDERGELSKVIDEVRP